MHVFALFFSIVAVVEAEIEMVQAIFRHGDRAASGGYPNDPHSELAWPRGYSQLTEQGYAQGQELGEYLRYRYMQKHTTAPEKYNRKEVHVRSSDKDRCIETAMAVVSTLYPGQIVPVHTYSTHKKDLLLKPNSVRCDLVDKIVSKDKEVLYVENDRKYADFFAHVSRHTGMHVSMRNVKDVYNAVYREHVNGLSQPDWVFEKIDKAENRTVFDLILELKRQDRMESFNSFEKSRRRTGYLLGQLTSAMHEKSIGISKGKLVLYATHDATLTSLLYSLDVSNDLLPPYASAILLELHNIREEYFVKLLFRNSTTAEPHVLRIPGCQTVLCPLAQFQNYVAPRIIHSEEERQTQCNIDTAQVAATVPLEEWYNNVLYLVIAIQLTLAVQMYVSKR